MLNREGERMGSSEKQILSREWAIFRCIGSVEHPHTQSTYKICTSVNESEQTNGTEHCTCTPLVYMQIYMPYSTPLQYGMLCRAIQMIISPLNICTYILYKYIKADHGFIFMERFKHKSGFALQPIGLGGKWCQQCPPSAGPKEKHQQLSELLRCRTFCWKRSEILYGYQKNACIICAIALAVR